MREVVSHLRMHSTLHVPGIGNLEEVLPSPSKALALKMHYTPGEHVIRAEMNGISVSIPLTNIKYFLSSPEPAIIVKKGS